MKTVLILALVAAFTLAGCASNSPSVPDQRESILKMRNETLAELYKAKPETKGKIEKAAGYGVFSNFGVTVVFVGGAGGHGVVRNNASKKDTFMNMGQAQAGLGVGAAKYKAVFIFKDAKTLKTFIDKGWEFGGQGGGVAKAGKSGGADTSGSSVHPGIEIFQLSETGAILSVTVAGTKYWKDSDLN